MWLILLRKETLIYQRFALDPCKDGSWDSPKWQGIPSFGFKAADSHSVVIWASIRRVFGGWLHPKGRLPKLDGKEKNPSWDDKSWSSNKLWLSMVCEAVDISLSSTHTHTQRKTQNKQEDQRLK